MEDGFFSPTKYKLVMFVIITLALFYLPVVPVFVQPVVAPQYVAEASHWGIASAADTLAMSVGANMQSFGLFAGTEGSVLNMIYILAAGYILACLLLYGYHKIHG